MVLPYIRHVSESIKRILNPLGIRTCFKPHTTLRKLLVHPKGKIPQSEIYKIPCMNCNNKYIGQTGQTLDHRIKEHKRALTSNDTNTSAVAEHAIVHNHLIDWNNAEVVDKSQKLYQRCYLESWHNRERK